MALTRQLWRRWLEGVASLGGLYAVVTGLAVNLAATAFAFRDMPITFSVLGFITIVALYVGFPIAFTWDPGGAEGRRRKMDGIVEAGLDDLARDLGIDWAADEVLKVGPLVEARQWDDASKLYRHVAGVTWDEADAALLRWDEITLARKLALIRQRTAASPQQALQPQVQA
jgi:hypothetical protein